MSSGKWAGQFEYYGLTTAQKDAFLAAVPEVLGRRPMTREQLAAAVAKRTGLEKLRNIIVTANWGSPLKPSALRVDLCFGPNKGAKRHVREPPALAGQVANAGRAEEVGRSIAHFETAELE